MTVIVKDYELNGSPYDARVGEKIPFTIDVSLWADTPANPVLKVYDCNNNGYTDVTSTWVPSGSCSIQGTNILTPPVWILARGSYRADLEFTYDGGTYKPYFMLDVEV